MSELPDYDDLPAVPGLDLRHAWDVWGRDDVLGSVNLVTPARVARAAAGVRTGELFPLDLPLDEPNPPLYGRTAYQHHRFRLNRHEMDDRLDAFHPQASTQWDALSHVRCREHGFWGGRTEDPVDAPNPLGIEHWARHGIAGRGILLDVGALLARRSPGYDPLDPVMVTADDLAEVLDAAGVTPEQGDVWCVRFGWFPAYRRLDATARAAYAVAPHFAGLRADEAMARFLWNHHPAALVCDNPAVEVQPGDPSIGSLHRRLLPTLGTALGEMFDLERLAAACAADDRYDFFFVANPLHVPGGIGSPGNAVAIR